MRYSAKTLKGGGGGGGGGVRDAEKCKHLKALESEAPLIHSDIDDLKEFVKTVMYNRRKSESYIQTRIRLQSTTER